MYVEESDYVKNRQYECFCSGEGGQFVRWFLAVMICLFVAGGMMAGCGSQENNKAMVAAAVFEKPQYNWGKISGQTIVLWGDATDLERPFYKRAFEQYERRTGNTLQIERLSKVEMARRVQAAFIEATEEKPDIVLSYGGTNLDRFRPDENFYDFKNAQWLDDLTGTSINQSVYNGRIVGLPYNEVSISGTLYNKALFKKYDLQAPRTQAEFMEVCEILLQHGITPVYLPYAEVSMLLYQFPMDSIVKDQKILTALNEGKLSYADIPEMKKIIEWYKTMAERGYFGTEYEQNDWAGMAEALRSEKYAMMLCWDTWLYTDFTGGDPTKFGLMPAFMGVPEGGCFEGPNMSMLTVNRHSPKLEAALDLITFLADPYNYNTTFAGIYTAPAFKNQVANVSTPQYVQAERLIDKHFFDSTAGLRIRGFSQMDAAYIQKYMKSDGTYSVEDCLRDMDEVRRKRAGI